MTKKTELENSLDEIHLLVQVTKNKIKELGVCDDFLYRTLICIQTQFDAIRGISDDKKEKYEEIKKDCVTWKQHVDKINDDYIGAQKANVELGAVGTAAGVGVALLGPTAAMGIATTFGVASTGTAIATLHGVAATNAALAWLGGGTLAVGGGGMSAGSMLLGLAGPVGWTIAGLTLISSTFLFWKAKSEKKRLENIFLLVSKRDKCSYESAIVELNERIRQIKDENSNLQDAIKEISTFGTDYTCMTEEQQCKLGIYVNIMNSAAQLLKNPILRLQTKYSENDLNNSPLKRYINNNKDMVIYMVNFLYGIKTEKPDWELLSKSFRKNNDFIQKMGFDKEQIDVMLFKNVNTIIEYLKEQKKE